MARPRSKTALQSSIESILAAAAGQIAAAVRQDLAATVQRALGAVSTGKRLAVRGPARPQHVPSHCIHPGCTRPSKGPRFTFMCDEHKQTSKADKKKYLEQWKREAAPRAAAKPRRKK